MRESRIFGIFLTAVCVMAMMFLGGCTDKSGGTYDEPEITAEYLMGEYAEQLETDGAESIIGKIHFVETDDSYDVVVNEMEIVPSEDYDKGYYIANSNLEVTFDFGLDCRVVCDGEDGPVVVTADDFFKDYNDDNKALYCVYYFGDQAELILAVHPKDEI